MITGHWSHPKATVSHQQSLRIESGSLPPYHWEQLTQCTQLNAICRSVPSEYYPGPYIYRVPVHTYNSHQCHLNNNKNYKMINVWGDGAAELVSLKYQIQSKTIVTVTHWSKSFSRQSQSPDTLKIITVTKIVSNRHWSRTLTCHEHWLNSCFSKSGTLDSATYCITVPLIPTLQCALQNTVPLKLHLKISQIVFEKFKHFYHCISATGILWNRKPCFHETLWHWN